jgi:hypothetical protein
MAEPDDILAKRAHGYKLQLGSFHRFTGPEDQKPLKKSGG